MKHKYVKNRSTEIIYEILRCGREGYADLKDVLTDEILRHQDIHFLNNPDRQNEKEYVYVDYPETESVKSEFYSVF